MGMREAHRHIQAVVICGRSGGSWEPLATILIREGQELERTTDRKLQQHIAILIRLWNAPAIELKNACRIDLLIVHGLRKVLGLEPNRG